ncbi:adenylate kinase [Streptococcus suis]|nr:adenylate kinase [Streptococcus suis]
MNSSKKIMVIGCPGSGKSTLSRKLHEITGIPLFHLDLMNWNSDRTCVEKDVFIQRLLEVINGKEWIVDGNYDSTLELRMKYCDTIIFLDYPVELCLQGMQERRGKQRPDMPWIESVDDVDSDFIEFINNFRLHSRPKILELLEKYSDKEIYILKSMNQANNFLTTYCSRICK